MVTERVDNTIEAKIMYGKTAAGATLLPVLVVDNGDGTATLKVDTELTATIDPTGLATSAKQDTEKTAIDAVTTAVGTVKTAVDAVTTKLITTPATEAKQPALEGTDKAKISVWVKKAANGDTVLTLGKAADADSLPVALSTEFLALFGEKQESPTQYTLLERIKVLETVLGIPSGIKVITDADGTQQQYLRGLVSLLAAAISSNKLQVDVNTGAFSATGLTTAAAAGVNTDAPASVSVDEDGTARTHTSLLKGAKNLLIDISGFLSALKFGDQNKAASLSVTPAMDITDGRYIGSVKGALAYKGPDRKTMAGAAQESTIASGTKCVVIAAEGGDIRFAVNADATSSSAGYIIAGGQIVAWLVEATKLSVYGPTGAYANIMYYG